MIEAVTLYHGTNNPNITLFEKYSYFTNDWKLAASFGLEKDPNSIWIYVIKNVTIELIHDIPFVEYSWSYKMNDAIGGLVFQNKILVKSDEKFQVFAFQDDGKWNYRKL